MNYIIDIFQNMTKKEMMTMINHDKLKIELNNNDFSFEFYKDIDHPNIEGYYIRFLEKK